MRYIHGENRYQQIMFPDSIDKYIEADNTVRVIDAFVDSLVLEELGFKISVSHTGRPPYNPSDILKLYIYGYFNKIRSSRKLETETKRNIELMWLLNKLSPDHKTISRFRKENAPVLKNVFRSFVKLCINLNLYGKELIAIDGSKFKAVNSNDKNFNKEKLDALLKRIDDKLEHYLSSLNENDSLEECLDNTSKKDISSIILSLQEKKKKYEDMKTQLKETGETQISLIDPDARRMSATNKTNGVSYNIQSAVDDKNKLILEYDVTNKCNDVNLLFPMAKKVKDLLNINKFSVVADKGYFVATDISECIQNNITPHVSSKYEKVSMCIPSTEQKNQFNEWHNSRGESIFIPERNIGVCSMGQILLPRGYLKAENVAIYSNVKVCKVCKYKEKCSKTYKRLKIKMPEINFKKEYNAENLTLERLNYLPDKNILKKRKTIVEHPFGTIKRHLNSGYCLLKGLENVQGEFALTFLAYNLKRVINILGIDFLLKVLQV